MQRFELSDISFKRVVKAIYRRVLNFRNLFSWLFFNKQISPSSFNKSSDTCIIICNGPSLKNVDVRTLQKYDCFSMNRAYLSFDDWGFIPKYHVCINGQVIQQFSKDLENISAHKFYNRFYRNVFSKKTNINFLYLGLKLTDKVINKFSSAFSSGGTVTFVSIQLAMLLGYKKILIVGMDHNFTNVGKANELAVMKSDDENHYRNDYFPKGISWEYPDLKRSELGYKKLNDFASDNKIKIIDCTINGKCNIFNKSSLDNEL